MVVLMFLVWVHSWYPAECCGGQDCHPVSCESLVETEDGVRWGELVFKGEQIRASQDGGCHVCYGLGEPTKPFCVFIRTSS